MDSKRITAPVKVAKGTEIFPGCFKKSTAFFLDQIVIALIGMGLLFPFSGFMSSLSVHAWLPGYIIGAIYYMVLESSFFKSASLAKMAFSIEVRTVSGNRISPLVSLIRYILITLPFYNNTISQSIASSIGITNTTVGGGAFLFFVGLLFVGNTLFMVLHPQKRGIHDILLNTVVVHRRVDELPKIQAFAKKPVFGGIVGLLMLGLVFGNLYMKQGKDPDFAGIEQLSEKIRQQSGIDNLSVSYRKFGVQDKITVFSVDVHVPLSYERFGNSEYTKELLEKLYPMTKKFNTNSKVNTITVVFHTQRFIGAFPISKYTSDSRKITEIRDRQ